MGGQSWIEHCVDTILGGPLPHQDVKHVVSDSLLLIPVCDVGLTTFDVTLDEFVALCLPKYTTDCERGDTVVPNLTHQWSNPLRWPIFLTPILKSFHPRLIFRRHPDPNRGEHQQLLDVLVVLNGIVTSNIPSKRMPCECKILYTYLNSPFFHILDEVINRFLGREFEPQIVIWPRAPSHAYDVDEIYLKPLREWLHHLIEESSRRCVTMDPDKFVCVFVSNDYCPDTNRLAFISINLNVFLLDIFYRDSTIL